MDSSGELECTQVLHDNTQGNPPERLETEKLQVACLAINATQFPIYNGDTYIGRDPKRCSVVLDRKSVSSHHALIEVESGHHLICDLGSSNSTRLNGMLLKPHVRYNLTNAADVQIADLKGIYRIESAKADECDTSSDDIFATPDRTGIGLSLRRGSLNFSGDDSVIGSTPMRSDFKPPPPRITRITSNSSQNHSNTIYQQVTICQSVTEKALEKTDIYEAETQTEEESDTSLFNDTLDDSNCQKVISSFVVPCTQELTANSSIQLHYETDQSMNDSSEDCNKKKTALFKEKAVTSVASSSGLSNSRSNGEEEYDTAELSDVEQKFIVEEMDKIERSMSSELQASNIPDEVKEATSIEHKIKNDKNISCKKSLSAKNIHDAATQIVESVASDSETDDEGVYGACTEAPSNKDDIHDAKTQMIDVPTSIDVGEDDNEDQATSSNEKGTCKTKNIHDAATQIVDTVASDSETDDEGVHGACTEVLTKDDIHVAKTQVVDVHTGNKDGSRVLPTPSYHNESTDQAENIHETPSQNIVSLPTSTVDNVLDEPSIHSGTLLNPGGTVDILEPPTTYAKRCSPRKSLSLSRMKKKNKESVAVSHSVDTLDVTPVKNLNVCAEKKGSVVDTNDEDVFCSAATQILLSPGHSKSVPVGQSEKEDIFTAATQILLSPGHSKSVCVDQSEKEEDIFSAATQILTSPGAKKSVLDVQSPKEEDIFTAATQILLSPGHSKSVPDGQSEKEGDIFSAATQILPSPGPRKSVLDQSAFPAAINQTSATPSDVKKVSKSLGKSPLTRSRILNSTAEQRRASDQSDKESRNISNLKKESTTKKTHQSSQRLNSKRMKIVRSSSPEADIEDISSDSLKSVDHMIDDSDDDNVTDSVAINSKALKKELSDPKKKSVLSPSVPSVSTVSLETVSPIISRTSGRRTLSLSRSHFSNASELKTSTQEKTTDLKLADSQTALSVVSKHRVLGVTPLISVTSHTEEDLPLDISDKVKTKRNTRRTVRNNQNIELKMEADASPSDSDCISEETPHSGDLTKSILKLNPEAKPSRKSVSFVGSKEVKPTEQVEKGKKSLKSEAINEASNASLSTHTESDKTEMPENKFNKDGGPPLKKVYKNNKTQKLKRSEKSNQEIAVEKSDPQDSTASIEIETSELSQTANRRSSRAKKQPASVENKEGTKVTDESVDFAKPNPSQRIQRTSKRKAENVAAAEETSQSSQTSNSSQESSTSDIGTRRSSRARKQQISESSEDGSIPEPLVKRPSKSRKATDAPNSSIASSSESLTSIPDTEPQTATRKSSRSRKLPSKLTEDIPEQSSSTVKTRSRKDTQKNTEEEGIGKTNSSEGLNADGERGNRRSSNKKPAASKEKETEVKGVKRSLSQSSEKDLEAGPSKLSRQRSTLKPVSETYLENSILDESLPLLSLKRGQELDESFASDVGLESKRPKSRRNSVASASTSTSPRRSPRPRQSLKGTVNKTTHVLFSFLNNPRHENLVKQLGGVIVDSVDSADVLVTDKLRRTVKLLCFLGRGLPVVGPPWLLHSKAAGRLLDPWEHILTDRESETKFNANLSESLKKSGQNPILQGYHIHVTKNVKPIPEEIKAIVTSCSGIILPRAPSVWPPNSIAISCPEDKPTWTKYSKKIPILSPEWLLQGVLRQHLNFEDHRLNEL